MGVVLYTALLNHIPFYLFVNAYVALITVNAITDPIATADAIPLNVKTLITIPPKMHVTNNSPLLEVFIIYSFVFTKL